MNDWQTEILLGYILCVVFFLVQNPGEFRSNARIEPLYYTFSYFLKSWLKFPFFNEWQGTEIDPRICKISENIFYLANLKVLIKLPTKPKNEGPPTQGYVVILSSKNGFQKQMETKKSVIGLSKSILLITIEFLIKFRVYGWIQNFWNFVPF